MSKLYPRLIAALFAICCWAPAWAQLTIEPGCSDQLVQCTEDLDAVTCPVNPIAYQAGEELSEPAGTAACILASEKQSNRVHNTATTAVPLNGADAGALVLYNIQAFGVNSQYYTPKPGVGLKLEQFEPVAAGEKGIAILSGVVQGVEDPSEEWKVFAVYEGETSGADWVANGGGLKYEHDCLQAVQDHGDDWQIYTMSDASLSFLEGQGSLTGSLLTLSHAPANNYFGFQVGEGANDRNCNYGAGGWFGWEGTIMGSPAAGAMGDFLVDLDPSQDCYEACDSRVTCFCVATDEDDNIFEVFECVTQRDDTTPPTMTNAPADVTIACTDNLPAPPTPMFADNCTDVCAPTWALTPYLAGHEDVCGIDGCDIVEPFLVSYNEGPFIPDPSLGAAKYVYALGFEDWNGGPGNDYTSFYRYNLSADGIISKPELMFSIDEFDDDLSDSYWPIAYDRNPATGVDYFIVGDGPRSILTYDIELDEVVDTGVEFDEDIADFTFGMDGTCYAWINGNIRILDLATGDVSPFASAGGQGGGGKGLTYDYHNDRLLLASGGNYNSSEISVGAVSLATGAYELLHTVAAPESNSEPGEYGTLQGLEYIGAGMCLVSGGWWHHGFGTLDLTSGELTWTTNTADVNPNQPSLKELFVPMETEGCGSVTRTWVFEDDCGNQDSHTQVITISDEEAPTWDNPALVEYVFESCLVILTQEDAECENLVPVTATDNCDSELTYSITATELSGGCPVTWHRTWTAMDNCGNVSEEFHQYVQLKDEVAPVVTAPANATIYLDSNCDYDADPSVTGTASATDHCSTQERLDTMMTYTDVINPVTCSGGYGSFTITRTWSTTDYCLNEASDTQTITVIDNTAPYGTVNDVTIDCASYNANTEYGTASATDNCTPSSAIAISWVTTTTRQGALGGNNPGCYYYDRQYTFTDACGNSSTQMQRVWLSDTTAPTLTNAPVSVTVSCDDYAQDLEDQNSEGLIAASDVCGNANITFTDVQMSGGCVTPIGMYERTYTIADDCGNSIQHTQFVTLTDNEAPTLSITCPATVTIESDAYCTHDRSAANTGTPSHIVDDNCDADPNVQKTYVDGPDQLVCQGHFSFERTWTVMAIDHCFNFTTLTCTQTINVIDDTAPSLPSITCPEDITLYADEDCYADTDTSVTGAATAVTMDNCDTNPDMEIWYMDGAPVYTCEADAGVTVNLEATLGALESTSASFNDDLVAVGLHIEMDWESAGCTEWPSDLTLELTSPAGDCVTISGYTSLDPNPACEAHAWPISWNTTTAGLFVMDFEFDEHMAGAGEWTLSVLENYDGACGVALDLEATVVRRAEGDHHFVRTWYAQATDCSMNESQVASCEQIISIKDIIAPVFGEFDMEIDIACDEFEEDALYGGINASDNCDSNVRIEVLYNEDCDGDLVHGYDNVEVSGGCAGSYLRTYLATDDCGNTTTTVQAINLIDDEAPVVALACPADIEISKDEECFANDTRSGAGEAEYDVTDNCSVDSVCVIVNDGPKEYTCENSYSFVREWIVLAYDACNNEGADTCYQTVTVVDNSAPAKPIINCPADVVRYRNDNCFTDVSPCIPAGCNGPGSAGTGNLTIDYIVNDNTVAVGGCCDNNMAGSGLNYDNCTSDDDLITVINYSDTPVGDVNCTHYIERHWTAYFIDECNNQSEIAECTQIINIIDNTAPTITADATFYIDCEEFDPTAIYATVSDNCDPNADIELIDQDMIMPGTCAGLFQNTYRATDCSGNQVTMSHLVQLVDTVAPTFVDFPADAVVECGDGTEPSDIGEPDYAGNCDSEGVSIDYVDIVATFKDDDCQTIERHWTITDACGNATTQVQEYQIEDTGYPVITTPACSHTFQCDGEGNMAEFENWLATHAGAAATDDCSDINWDYEVPVVSAGPNPYLSDGCGKSGDVTVTFYATDACGNSTPTTATFTVVDTIAPSLENIDLPEDVTLAQTLNCDRNTGVNVTGIPSADASLDICCYNFVSISHEDGPISCLCEPDDDFPFYPSFEEEELVTFAQIEAAIDGTVSFDWAYSTDDEGAEYDVAFYVDTELIDVMGDDEQSGSFSVEVSAGQMIGFGIYSMDNILGEARVEITNFSGPSGMDFIGVYDDAQWEQHEGYNGSLDWSHDGESLLITGSDVELECEGSYEFIRTWTLYAFDECDNQSEHLVHEQLIQVIDTIAPQFTETCGNENGEQIAIDYDDAFGNCTIPAPCNVEAEDNCDSDIVLSCTVDTIGEYAPTGNVRNYSLATTPAAYQYGETCNGMTPHALRLMNLPNDDIYYDIIGEALMTELETGEVMLTCSLESHIFAGTGFIMTLKLLPEAMADDIVSNDGLGALCLADLGALEDLVSCNLPDIGSDFPKYIVDCRDGDDNLPVSRLVGYGSYGGSDLALRHQPANSYYGFQIGVGANQQNANFGMSGWFFYEGHFLGQPVMSSGDLFCDLDCTLPWGIQYCCTAIDDCENERTFCYTYSITGEIDNGPEVFVSGDQNGGDHTPVVIGGAGDLTTGKTPIRVTNLQPNPTNDLSQLGFVVTENMRIRVDLIGMDGVLVAELYDGVAQTGVNHTLDIPAEGLSSGMYQVRLTSNDYLVVKKLLVND